MVWDAAHGVVVGCGMGVGGGTRRDTIYPVVRDTVHGMGVG